MFVYIHTQYTYYIRRKTKTKSYTYEHGYNS